MRCRSPTSRRMTSIWSGRNSLAGSPVSLRSSASASCPSASLSSMEGTVGRPSDNEPCEPLNSGDGSSDPHAAWPPGDIAACVVEDPVDGFGGERNRATRQPLDDLPACHDLDTLRLCLHVQR